MCIETVGPGIYIGLMSLTWVVNWRTNVRGLRYMLPNVKFTLTDDVNLTGKHSTNQKLLIGETKLVPSMDCTCWETVFWHLERKPEQNKKTKQNTTKKSTSVLDVVRLSNCGYSVRVLSLSLSCLLPPHPPPCARCSVGALHFCGRLLSLIVDSPFFQRRQPMATWRYV